jgi:hypothetical protein
MLKIFYFTLIYSRNHNTLTIIHFSIFFNIFQDNLQYIDKVDRFVTHFAYPAHENKT